MRNRLNEDTCETNTGPIKKMLRARTLDWRIIRLERMSKLLNKADRFAKKMCKSLKTAEKTAEKTADLLSTRMYEADFLSEKIYKSIKKADHYAIESHRRVCEVDEIMTNILTELSSRVSFEEGL